MDKEILFKVKSRGMIMVTKLCRYASTTVKSRKPEQENNRVMMG